MTFKRRFLVPEVVQTSGMDCGPASLKCLLEGYRVRVSYGRLREACQTDVDGTSIDTMEEIANQLGLQAQQVLVPSDHVLLPALKNLPAIVVVQLPSGFTHFVVVWRRHGKLLQVMDPASGRRLVSSKKFLQNIYQHSMIVAAEDWREFAGDEGNIEALYVRMRSLGLTAIDAKLLADEALSDASWLALGTLDAAIRLTQSLLDSSAFKAGREAKSLLTRLFAARFQRETLLDSIPAQYWSAQPAQTGDETQLSFRGAVLVRVQAAHPPSTEQDDASDEGLSPELLAALRETPPKPLNQLFGILREGGALAPFVTLTAMLVSGLAVILEILLLRSVLDLSERLGLGWQRIAGTALLGLFFLLITLLHYPTFMMLVRIGRHLEIRLRKAFLQKIPHIGDRYFRSRPRSDMADRSHRLMDIRQLPLHAGHLILGLSQIVTTTIAITWLYPDGIVPTVALSLVSLVLPLISQPFLTEVDMRVRTHSGALSKFYLDGLLGLIPLRSHVAEQAMRHQHERLVVEWSRAKHEIIRISLGSRAVQLILGVSLKSWLVVQYLQSSSEPAHVLLIVYWVLALPNLGLYVADMIHEYPGYRNLLLRLMEPLNSPNETSVDLGHDTVKSGPHKGVQVSMREVDVFASGRSVLQNLTLEVWPGEHVAVVGPSGAGKSALVGLLLGWYKTHSGSISIDGNPLTGANLESLRERTAWVDPAVQIWNQSLLKNLSYGRKSAAGVSDTLQHAELLSLLERMEDGLQTVLGEGGSLVSGGEGQRVRLGRAMMRAEADLVILDEPFRGLDRQTRSLLLDRSRALWESATLFCVSHDISETVRFPRVLVVVEGRIVEDGSPTELREMTNSVYSRMLAAERKVMSDVWGDPHWRKLTLRQGQLREGEEIHD